MYDNSVGTMVTAVFNFHLTNLERMTALLTACLVSGYCYHDFVTYFAFAMTLRLILGIAIWWAKNWFGGNP